MTTDPPTSMGPRNMAAAMRAVLDLQRSGGKLIEVAQSRERVVTMMQGYMRRLAIDADSLPPVIHIAGTKGKGSTAAMCDSILRAAGLRTALYTSPHLISVRERFRLNGVPVDEPRYLRYFWETWDGLRDSSRGSDDDDDPAALPAMPGFFHFLTLLALKMFRGEGVDVAVLEVGLGGRLDATNVIPHPVVCGVTTLDFDHMDVLGDTLPLIAAEKAGIFKRGVPAVTVPQRRDALETLQAVASDVGAPLLLADQRSLFARVGAADGMTIGLDGEFQRTNAALAVSLCDIFLWRRCLSPLPSSDGRDEGILTSTTLRKGGSTSTLAAALPWQRALLSAGVTASDKLGHAMAPSAAKSNTDGHFANNSVAPSDSSSIDVSNNSLADVSIGPSDVSSSSPAGVSNNSPAGVSSNSLARFDSGDAPLPRWTLDGLSLAKWAGRAQILRVLSGTGPPMQLPSPSPIEERNRCVPRSPRDAPSQSPPPSQEAGSSGSIARATAGSAASAPAIDSHLITTFYLDGAHTERSVQECVAWFRSRITQHSHFPRREKLVLLIYSGTEKEPLQLLLPLSTLPVDEFVITAPPSVRPSRHSTPSTTDVLLRFEERTGVRVIGDQTASSSMPAATSSASRSSTPPAIGHSATLVAPAPSVGSSLITGTAVIGAAGGGAAGGSMLSDWLHTVASLWEVVHSNRVFDALRRELSSPPSPYSADGVTTTTLDRDNSSTVNSSNASSSRRDARALPGSSAVVPMHESSISQQQQQQQALVHPATTTALVIPDVAAAIAHIRRQASLADADGEMSEYHVLVTGSLYLVGAALETLGWKEQ